MNKALAVVFVALGCYLAVHQYHINIPIISKLIPGMAPPPPFGPLYQKPYIIVYGRDSCGFTKAMRDNLTERKIPFVYKTVDDDASGDELLARMNSAGMQTDNFDLPVVDVNAELLVRPAADVVVRKYSAYSPLSPAKT